jgi:hypothetical protein
MDQEILNIVLDLVKLAGGLLGIAALATFAVNFGKSQGWIADGQAINIQAGVALLVVLVGYASRWLGVELDWAQIDSVAATLAQLGGLLVTLAAQVGFTKIIHGAVKGVKYIGYSYTDEAKKA